MFTVLLIVLLAPWPIGLVLMLWSLWIAPTVDGDEDYQDFQPPR